jgi:hypothetical protein
MLVTCGLAHACLQYKDVINLLVSDVYNFVHLLLIVVCMLGLNGQICGNSSCDKNLFETQLILLWIKFCCLVRICVYVTIYWNKDLSGVPATRWNLLTMESWYWRPTVFLWQCTLLPRVAYAYEILHICRCSWSKNWPAGFAQGRNRVIIFHRSKRIIILDS